MNDLNLTPEVSCTVNLLGLGFTSENIITKYLTSFSKTHRQVTFSATFLREHHATNIKVNLKHFQILVAELHDWPFDFIRNNCKNHGCIDVLLFTMEQEMHDPDTNPFVLTFSKFRGGHMLSFRQIGFIDNGPFYQNGLNVCIRYVNDLVNYRKFEARLEAGFAW